MKKIWLVLESMDGDKMRDIVVHAFAKKADAHKFAEAVVVACGADVDVQWQYVTTYAQAKRHLDEYLREAGDAQDS